MPPTNWSDPHSIATTQADDNLTDVALLQRYMSEVQREVSRFDVKCDEILSGMLRSTPISTPARGRGEGLTLGHQDAHSHSDSDSDSETVQGPGQQATPSDTTVETRPPSAQPHTPVAPTTLHLDEISPTDTNFSLSSIFSSPIQAHPSSISPTSSCSSSEPATCSDEDQDQDKDKDQDHVPHPNDYLPIGPLDPSAPHLIILTSCLPCVLASLPCSRTLPTCTRCTRNARLCLPQRKRLWQELRNDGWNMEPMLVRGEDEGDEAWGVKLRGMKELLDEWRGKHEQSFWAPMEARLAWGAGHPGEGKGRVVVGQMRIGSWHRGALEEAERAKKGGYLAGMME